MKKHKLYIFFFIITYLFISCTEKEDLKSNIYSVDQKLEIILTDPVETLDPLKILYNSDWKVANNIFEGLVAYNDQDEIFNKLVDSIKISENKLDYFFRLRNEIYFHDNPCFEFGKGRKLTSKDIKYTFERLATKENNFSNWESLSNKISGINNYYNKKVKEISGIKIIDSVSFIIHLTKPFSAFLKILTSPNFYIIPKEATEYYKDNFQYNPVGTGPYRISEFTYYEKVLLVKNKNYHSGENFPIINSIEYRTIKDYENTFSELFKNKTHFININQNEFDNIKTDTSLTKRFNIKTIDKGSGVRFWGFYFRNGHDTKEYKNLRKIIAQSFDRSFIKKENLSNYKAESLVPKYFFENVDIKWYDHQKIAPISKETNSLNVSILTNLEYRDLLEIESTLNQLNINFRRITQPKNYYGEIINIKPTLFRVSMIPAFPDPIEYYSLFYSKNSGSINLGNFTNDRYDKIYEAIQLETNKLKLQTAYLELEKILKEEVAALYLSHQGSDYYLFNNKLKNVKFNFTIPDFSQAYFTK